MRFKKIIHHGQSLFWLFIHVFMTFIIPIKRFPLPWCKNNVCKPNQNVIYLTFVGVAYDGRVRKSVDALLAKGCMVELIKPEDMQHDDVVSWHPNLIITPLGRSGSFAYFPYIYDWQIMRYIMRAEAKKIYCRDLFTGIMGVLSARLSGKESIVDFFEWYSEAKEYNYRKQCTMPKPSWKKKLFRFYERYICMHANRLITNNASFAKGIAQGVVPESAFTFIKNAPDSAMIKTDDSFKLQQFIPQALHHKKILYYVGQLSFDRKLDTLITGMQWLPDYVLLIQGSGFAEMAFHFKETIQQSSVADRVFFLPPIPDRDIINYAHTADIGVFICDSNDNKMFHALPNKLFEYIYAGIPQVSSDGIEIRQFIETTDVGLIFDAYDPASFAKSVHDISESQTYQRIKAHVLKARSDLIAEPGFQQI